MLDCEVAAETATALPANEISFVQRRLPFSLLIILNHIAAGANRMGFRTRLQALAGDYPNGSP